MNDPPNYLEENPWGSFRWGGAFEVHMAQKRQKSRFQ